MRWEWGDLIRYHRWDVFEQLVKTDPSQQLCDTIAELAQGLTDKADRKPLRKLLYLLRQKGFEPTDHSDDSDAAVDHLPNVGTYGVMLSPNRHGWRTYFFGQVLGANLNALLVHTLEAYQIFEPRQFLLRREAWPKVREDLLHNFPAPLAAEVESSYVLSRIRLAYENRPQDEDKDWGVKLNGFWKRMLQRVPAGINHPAGEFKMAVDVSPEHRRVAMQEHDALNQWQIYLAPDDPLMEHIHALRWNEELSSDQRIAAYTELLLDNRVRLCTDEVVQDLMWRFFDVAYILQAPEDVESWLIMHCAWHLGDKRYRSEVFEEVLFNTARALESDMEDDDEDPSSYPRQS